MKAFARLCEFWIEGDVCELIIKANDGTLRVRFEQIERSDAFARFLSGCRPNAKLFDFMDLTKLLFRNNSGFNSAKFGFQLKVENAGDFNLRFSSITISPGLDETTPGTTISPGLDETTPSRSH